MRKTMLTLLGLAVGCVTSLFAGETLSLQLVPEQSILLKGSPQEIVVKIDLSAIERPRKSHRPPLNLAVVLDKSGSMAGPKLEKARQAAMQLVDRLEPDDYFSMIVYSDQAEVLVPAQHVKDREALKEQIERIQAGGSTALFAGVRMGANQLQEYLTSRRINRIILLSDGLANVGPSTTRDLRRLGSQLAGDGISVTTVGVGDDYNEDLMAGLAEASDANYYYVQDTEKLPAIFAKELGEMLAAAARDVRIEITCPSGVEPLGFIGRSETFAQQKTVVTLSQFTPGQHRYLLLRCRVDGKTTDLVQANVHYKDELDNGSDQVAIGNAKVSYTHSATASEQSINATVTAEKVLMLTAVAKDEALTQADGGKLQDAAAKLASQKAQLDAVYANAPATVQVQIRAETDNLTHFKDQLEGGSYDSATRKTLQNQSYNSRNSK